MLTATDPLIGRRPFSHNGPCRYHLFITKRLIKEKKGAIILHCDPGSTVLKTRLFAILAPKRWKELTIDIRTAFKASL